jgi:hypothetical protein
METAEYYAGDNRSALMYENLPQAPRHRGGHRHPSTWKPPSGSSFIPSSLSTSALYPVHARIDSLSMSLVSIQNFISITYVIQFWITIIDNNRAAISVPLDNGYFTCFIDLLVSDAPLHSDVVLGVDWLSIVCTATLDYFLAWSQILIPTTGGSLPIQYNRISYFLPIIIH